MDYVQLLKENGWALVLLLFLLREAWPWLSGLISNERKLKLKAELEERQRIARLEERQVVAVENLVILTRSVDQRLTQVETLQTTIALGVTTLLERRNPPRAGNV
jgi:hypothetical protein